MLLTIISTLNGNIQNDIQSKYRTEFIKIHLFTTRALEPSQALHSMLECTTW